MTTTGPNPSLIREAVTALCDRAAAAGSPMRRKEARKLVMLHLLRTGPAAVLRGARNDLEVIDETGETAARNLDRIDWTSTVRRRQAAV